MTLGAVHRLIGKKHQVRRAAGLIRIHGHPDGSSHLQLHAVEAIGQGHSLGNAAGHLPHGSHIRRARQNDDEFVAAVSADEIPGPSASRNSGRHRHQQLIAGRVTVLVVHFLEPIEVNE